MVSDIWTLFQPNYSGDNRNRAPSIPTSRSISSLVWQQAPYAPGAGPSPYFLHPFLLKSRSLGPQSCEDGGAPAGLPLAIHWVTGSRTVVHRLDHSTDYRIDRLKTRPCTEIVTLLTFGIHCRTRRLGTRKNKHCRFPALLCLSNASL